MFHITIRSITLVVLLGVLAACAGNTPYRGNIQATCIAHQETDCTDSALQHHAPQQGDEYYLGFVEYDDQGQLRDRKQLQAVLDGLYPIAGTQDVLIVVFVHGWQHNASPGDANVAAFRQLLTKLARVEHDRKNGRKVLGIYLGWRGESVTVPGLKQLTFWERKNTAHEVGQQGITEVLLKLEEIVNVKAGMEESVPKPINSRLVVIGHSFGGAVVYAALQQVLTDRFIDSRRGKTHAGGAQGFGDLVVLVNPAFEALRYAPLYDLSQERCRGFRDQLPLLAILTSENDLATKYAFPTGRAFSTLFEAHNTLIRNTCSELGKEVEQLIDEGTADRQTVGHFVPYLSHRLNPASSQPRRASTSDFRQLKALWSEQSFGGKIPFEGSELVHLGKTQPLNPYLNIQVEKTLIADHNDIWGDQVLNFVRDLILISTLPESTAQPDESGIDGTARTIK